MTVPAAEGGRLASGRRPGAFAGPLAVGAIAAAVLLPLATLAVVAAGGSAGSAVLSPILAGSIATTIWLLALTALGAGSIGVVGAWLVVSYEFPLRRFLAFALVLPIALPPYLAAYAFGEFFNYTGPVQTLVRAVGGFESARDYWFPDIRSTPGAAMVFAAVLYPYVYLTTRIVFILQGRTIADAARTLGATPSMTFRRILLPVARPAIAAGLALALMETLNDVGASEYLGVRTLTLSVYTTWLGRNDLAGAARIALVLLLLVLLLIALERTLRRDRRYATGRATHLKSPVLRQRLRGARAGLATAAVALPVTFGFVIPVAILVRFAARRLDDLAEPAFVKAMANTVFTGAATAFAALALGFAVVAVRRLAPSGPVRVLARLAMSGYAIPGTILAVGLLILLGRIDNAVDAYARIAFGLSTGLLLSGSAAAVIIACTIRFLPLAESAMQSGIEKLPRHIDEAARLFGRGSLTIAATILGPLLRPALLTGGALVFVDTVKELSATILLRPFGFSTLATTVYEAASRGAPEDGALAALAIVLVALVPAAMTSRALMRDEAASV